MATVENVIARNLVSTIMNRAHAGTLRGATGYISEFVRLVNTQVADKKDIKQANERLAKAAGDAALKRYDARRAASDTPGEYRMGEGRVSGGRLRRAIASSDFVFSDEDGFAVGNITKLNKEAIHWARINWSAGPQATDYPTIRVKFDQTTIASIASKPKASPLWNIPKGAYFTGGELHINPDSQKPAYQIKKAHDPYHFIEVGFAEAAKRFGPEYETMMFGWLNKAGQDAKNFKAGKRLKGVVLR